MPKLKGTQIGLLPELEPVSPEEKEFDQIFFLPVKERPFPFDRAGAALRQEIKAEYAAGRSIDELMQKHELHYLQLKSIVIPSKIPF